jgi:hypothetical protein
MAKVSKIRKAVKVTPTITAGAYSSLDALGDEMIIDPKEIFIKERDSYVLQGLSLVDQGDQGAQIDLFFFSAAITPAADNAAFSISDADFIASFLGHIKIATTDYVDCVTSQVVSKPNINLPLKPADDGSGYVYCYARVTGTPSYASTSDLVFQFDLEIDN